MSIRDALADAINEDHSGYRSYISPSDIVKAEFRKGCAEIDVEYHASSGDYEYTETTSVDAAPVLTALLTWTMSHDE